MGVSITSKMDVFFHKTSYDILLYPIQMDDLGYTNVGNLHMKKSCQNAKVGFILFPSTRGRDWRIQALAQEDEDDEETEEFQEADKDEDEQVWRPAECHGVMVCQEMGYETNGENMGRLWFSKALDFGVHTKFLVSRKWPVNILVYTPVIKLDFLYFRSNEANCHVNKSPFSPEFYVSGSWGEARNTLPFSGDWGNPRSRIKLSGSQQLPYSCHKKLRHFWWVSHCHVLTWWISWYFMLLRMFWGWIVQRLPG